LATSLRNEIIPGWSADDPSLERLDVDLLARAYRFSAAAHEGQFRRNGDPFVTHCVEVARILAELQLDSITVAAGLIHDVVEDTAVTIEEVEKEFGPEMTQIVDGLTKIGVLPLHSTEERQVENYRKLLVSIAKDARVIIIKLADRLHNMRTLDSLPEDKQRRISLETRDLYAPLAHRFGMAKMRWELEDLAFKFLEQDDYRKLAKLVAARRVEREALIRQMAEPLQRVLSGAGIANVEVTGRAKHLWSIFSKMEKRERPYEEIYDLLAIRVLVNTVPDCYHALGVIHDGWTPLQERIKDYIAQPKSNGYQSLHTTVFGPGRQLYEIQIRTREMHRTAEIGIAAHWRYKTDAKSADELDRHLQWFRQVLELQLDAKDPAEFLEFLKLDLYQDEIFVFTPTGDVIQLPKGATPIDFAFAVHTEVGQHCAGAKVNGKIAPLSRQLRNSETVEILTSPNAKPSRDWLNFVVTSRARSKIRHVIHAEEKARSIEVGRKLFEKEARRFDVNVKALVEPESLGRAASAYGLQKPDDLFAAIGYGKIAPRNVLTKLVPENQLKERPPDTPLAAVVKRVLRTSDQKIRVKGFDDLMVFRARCCNPIRGESIVGYITRGKGVSVHAVSCSNVVNLLYDPERRIDVEWDRGGDGSPYTVRLTIQVEDRKGILADVSTRIAGINTNIRKVEASIDDEHRGRINMTVEISDVKHLQKVIKSLRGIAGVLDVERIGR